MNIDLSFLVCTIIWSLRQKFGLPALFDQTNSIQLDTVCSSLQNMTWVLWNFVVGVLDGTS